MAKSNPKKITLAQGISGYMLNIAARRLSQNTINDYTNTLTKFQSKLGNPFICDIKTEDIYEFMNSQTVSNKTLSNYHACLSGMWAWFETQGLATENIVKRMVRPKPETRVINPLSVDEIKTLLKFIDRSKSYKNKGRECDHALYNADRNRAIILFMLDNGIRVSELVNLKISDMDIKNLRCYVRQGKGAKDRLIPFSKRTGQALWRYLTTRGEYKPDDPLFVSSGNYKLTRSGVQQMLIKLGTRAGVPNVHPHRLRHTFSINYLRAGGDQFTLQAILGHTDSSMTRHYAQIAQIDIDSVHRRSSPVEFLRL